MHTADRMHGWQQDKHSSERQLRRRHVVWQTESAVYMYTHNGVRARSGTGQTRSGFSEFAQAVKHAAAWCANAAVSMLHEERMRMINQHSTCGCTMAARWHCHDCV